MNGKHKTLKVNDMKMNEFLTKMLGGSLLGGSLLGEKAAVNFVSANFLFSLPPLCVCIWKVENVNRMDFTVDELAEL